MKKLKLITYTLLLVFCFSCESDYDRLFRADTDEHFSLIKEWITELPKVPIYFCWEKPVRVPFDENTPVTSCLTTEVRFEKPYIIANGIRFHAYYWVGTQNYVGHTLKIDSTKIVFNHEK